MKKRKKKKRKENTYLEANGPTASTAAVVSMFQPSGDAAAQLGAAAQFGPSQPMPAAAPSLSPCLAGEWDPAVGCSSNLT
jgi:hypothetical protein